MGVEVAELVVREGAFQIVDTTGITVDYGWLHGRLLLYRGRYLCEDAVGCTFQAGSRRKVVKRGGVDCVSRCRLFSGYSRNVS